MKYLFKLLLVMLNIVFAQTSISVSSIVINEDPLFENDIPESKIKYWVDISSGVAKYQSGKSRVFSNTVNIAYDKNVLSLRTNAYDRKYNHFSLLYGYRLPYTEKLTTTFSSGIQWDLDHPKTNLWLPIDCLILYEPFQNVSLGGRFNISLGSDSKILGFSLVLVTGST
ncbi:MAG: hypothetical protein HQ509_00555 [Candidatus Marinimicrobia bacterium]|nr:hypothetical protein [Candidatus Neomarinimicrobiota bacterium]